MHSDMKVVHQLLVEDVHSTNDPLTRDGSSVLGKYIIGAKNNFRGFSSRQEDKSASLQVTVHHGEEEAETEKVKVGSAEVSDLHVDQGEESGQEEFGDCIAVKVEEGRAKAKLPAARAADGREPEGADSFTLREKAAAAAAGFNHVEDEAKADVEWDEAEQRRGQDAFTGARGGEKHTEGDSEEAGSGGENADMRTVLNKFKDIELHDKRVEAKWSKGRKLENHVTEKTEVREEKVESKKTIPSPTGSNSSQDTGFGSQEGEGSIDGILVMP